MEDGDLDIAACSSVTIAPIASLYTKCMSISSKEIVPISLSLKDLFDRESPFLLTQISSCDNFYHKSKVAYHLFNK